VSWVASGPIWTPDGKSLLATANRREDWDLEPLDSEVYAFAVADGSVRALTDRRGPDTEVAISPDGTKIAYTGFDERYQGYQVSKLYVRELTGGAPQVLAEALDRSAERPVWSADGMGVYFTYTDHGVARLALAGLDGSVETVAESLGGGLSAYAGAGPYSVGPDGTIAYVLASWNRPGDVAVIRPGAEAARLVTSLNDDLFGQRSLATIDTFTTASSKDQRPIQAWVLEPPELDEDELHPLILEIHGGPFAAYGPVFDIEKQVWAARGYVIVYANPRGSTSYGEEFGNLIHHAYPGDDFHDLDSVVSAMLKRGDIDSDRVYVTGGSGGGVLTCWMIGRSARFRAAATVYPVINWFSWVLTSDLPSFGVKYWFPGPPWEHTEHYMKRSLFSVFAEVTTPTLVITGEEDWRTPISESEQYYTALKLKGVETELVRVPGEPHGIRVRPSHHLAKMLSIVGWFDRHGGRGPSAEARDREE
jgi:acylaminoacyl-peptidase